MASRYGHRWASQFGEAPHGLAGAEWRDTLTGVDRGMLRDGFRADALRGDEWPPSSTRFCALCYGIPTFEEVESASRAGAPESNGFLRLVHGFIDGWEYQRAESTRAREMLRAAYRLACQHVMGGGKLPAEPVAYIGKPEKRSETPEEAQRREAAAAKALEEMRRTLGVAV